MNSIKTKYVALFGSLIIIVCVGLGLVSYMTSRNALEEVSNDFIIKTVNESTKVLEERANLRLAEVSTWANTDIIKNPNISSEEKLTYLKKEVVRGGYLSAGFGDLEGNVTVMSGAVINLSERPYYQSVLQGNTEVTDPIVSREDNTTLIVNYTVPIYDDGGKVIGVLIGARNGDELSSLTNDIVLGKTGTAFMVNQIGSTVAHTDLEKVKAGENIIELAKTTPELENLAKVISEMIKREPGVGSYHYEGKDKIVAYAPVKNSNWVLAVTVPKEEIFSALGNMQRNILLVSIIFLAIALVIIYFITDSLVKKIKMITGNLVVLSKGDFTVVKQRKHKRSNDELDKAYDSMLVMENSISAMIGSVKDTSNDIDARSDSLTSVSGELTDIFGKVFVSLKETNEGVSSQANSLTDISEILNNFGNKIDIIVKNIEYIDNNSKEINVMSSNGNKDMNQLIKSIESMSGIFVEFASKVNGLGSSINKITDITQMINDIAEQTNLLSLNAAIEAARAGESGKGFAVVADEIRKLAEQSKRSSQSINDLIVGISGEANLIMESTGGINKELDVQVNVVNSAIESYKNIVDAINDISSKISQANHSVNEIDSEKMDIISKVEDASSVAEEVAATSEEISESTRTVLESSEEVAKAAEEMSSSVKQMLSQISEFKV